MKLEDLSERVLLRVVSQFVGERLNHPQANEVLKQLHDALDSAGIAPITSSMYQEEDDNHDLTWFADVEMLSPVEKHILDKYFDKYPEGKSWDDLIAYWLNDDRPVSDMPPNKLGDLIYQGASDTYLAEHLRNERDQINELLKATR